MKQSTAPIRTYSRRIPQPSSSQQLRKPPQSPILTKTTSIPTAVVVLEPNNQLGEEPWLLSSSNNKLTTRLHGPAKRTLALRFYKGCEEDRDFLVRALIQVVNQDHRADIRVPGDWTVSRQVIFGDWIRIMGYPTRWEGGYLFVMTSSPTSQALTKHIVFLDKSNREDENGTSRLNLNDSEDEDGSHSDSSVSSLLDAPPRTFRTTKRVSDFHAKAGGVIWTKEERRRLELAIQEVGVTNWPKIRDAVSGSKTIADCVKFYEDVVAAELDVRTATTLQQQQQPQMNDPRLRARKWAQSTSPSVLASRLSQVRRLSLFPSAADDRRRSTLLLASHGGINTETFRRSSILPGKRSSMMDLPPLPDVTTTTTATRRSSIRFSVIGTTRSSIEDLASRRNSSLAITTTSTKTPNKFLPADMLTRVLSFISPENLLRKACVVSKEWNRCAVSACNAHFVRAAAYAAESSLTSRPPPAASAFSPTANLILSHKKFFATFPKAKFLADGAYKKVFLVHNNVMDRDEAISVMDIAAIAKTGDATVVVRELSVSLLLSEFVKTGICPNFVETHQVFQLARDTIWGNKKNAGSNNNPPVNGLFQYIRMEFCKLGDLESYFKTLPDQLVPVTETRSMLFQMLYSVHAARHLVSMRHFDIKCLNFFCTTTAGEALHYPDIGVTLPVGSVVVKLADYGTADTSPDTIGTPIGVEHFTTLENTPIEFLLFPNAPQTFASDSFSLGLAVVHVLTGAKPYEEIMESVQCPVAVVQAVAKIWETPSNGFTALHMVLDGDEDDILFHTLYRYVVLLGLPSSLSGNDDTENNAWNPRHSLVMKTVMSILSGDGVGVVADENKTNQKLHTTTAAAAAANKSTSKAVQAARKQFMVDSAKYSWDKGTDSLIARGRKRAEELGVNSLVRGLLEMDLGRRWSEFDNEVDWVKLYGG